jgi:septal ring factor EnvC (AmiA/AmiB activator)
LGCSYDHEVATLEDLEARVAALEASHADYRAVLAAVNVLGANQREMAMTLTEHSRDLAELKGDLAELKGGQNELTTGQRSLEENVAEIKDLLVRALDR